MLRPSVVKLKAWHEEPIVPRNTALYSAGEQPFFKNNSLFQLKSGAMSDGFQFKTMPVPSLKHFPRIGIVGDLGLTYNSTSTVSHLIKNNPDLMILVAYATYANLYLTNGTGSDCYKCSFANTPIHETYQLRWDYRGRYMQQLTSKVPMMVIEGKHEIEEQVGRKTFASYSARFAFQSKESGS